MSGVNSEIVMRRMLGIRRRHRVSHRIRADASVAQQAPGRHDASNGQQESHDKQKVDADFHGHRG
jgi:hypothetical protein